MREPVHFRLKARLNKGQVVHRHVDHIHKRHSSASATPDLNKEELSVESVGIPNVASQTDTDLVETSADESKHPEEVENHKNVPPNPTNMNLMKMSVDLLNMSIDPQAFDVFSCQAST